MIPVGTPVTVAASHDKYLNGYGMSRKDLVVLHHDGMHYGLGPAKNDPEKAHSGDGWIFFANHEVAVIPPFTFEDIQVGDTIRRTHNFKDGCVEVREGTVGNKKNWYVSNESGTYILAYDHDTKAEDTTLELLDRPEPEPEPVKAVWEDAKPGDVFKRVNRSGGISFLLKEEEGWKFMYENGAVNTFGQTVSHMLEAENYTFTKV